MLDSNYLTETGRPTRASPRSDRRGVSDPLSTVINLGIMVLVVSAIGYGGLTLIDDTVEQDATMKMEGFSQQVAQKIQFVDRQARGNAIPSEPINTTLTLPESVNNYFYTIEMEQSGPSSDNYDLYALRFNTDDESIDITGKVSTGTPIVERDDLDGGKLAINRPEPSDENVNSGYCEFIPVTVGGTAVGTNGEPGYQTNSDVESNPAYDVPDKCKIQILGVDS